MKIKRDNLLIVNEKFPVKYMDSNGDIKIEKAVVDGGSPIYNMKQLLNLPDDERNSIISEPLRFTANIPPDWGRDSNGSLITIDFDY